MIKKRLIVFGCTMLALVSIVALFAKDAVNSMNLGLDLKGGFEILYDVKPLEGASKDSVDMAAVASAVSKRVNVLGVSEPDISVEGDRIRVQLAGVKDNEQARNIISSSATLSFRDTSDNLLMDATVLQEGGASIGYQEGKPVVYLKIADTSKFYEVTSTLSQTTDKLMVTWLDYKDGQTYREESSKVDKDGGPAYISAATVSEGLNSESVVISGSFTEEEAQQLADLLNSGSLNFQMNEIYSNVVSPNLGVGAFDSTMLAGGIGILAIMIFLILIYRFAGIISAVAVAAYTFGVLVVYTLLGGVFTLSGIAALVLGVGMAVDSSVITFERIKDCLLMGRSVKQAYKEGNHKSLSTILDSQITTLLSAVILYTFGTGTVKGFATMLMISTILAIVFNVTIVRFLLGQVVKSGYLDNKKSWFGIKESDIPDLVRGESKKPSGGRFANFDFIKNAKYFAFVSLAVIVIGVGSIAMNLANGNGALDLGIDFSSGTRITMEAEKSFKSDTLEKELKDLGVDPSDITLSGKGNTVASVSIKDAITEEQREKIADYMSEKYKAEVSDSVVSPIIGQELVKNAFIMSILSWIGILIYVSIRFKWDYAISGIVALIHDVFIILAVFAIFRMEVTTDIIAVVLTIIGYSINDSIVVFDRMRENVAAHGRKAISNEGYYEIVNKSLQEIVVRSIITSVTTIIPVVCLLIFGSRNILDFNIALMVGLVAGTVSSLFIASQLWYILRIKFKPKNKVRKRHKKVDEVEEHIIPGVND
ncbi:SecD/SecF fusion protein [Breznakia sp. PF5-3]|uniref:protein translocase subunit SecD n=1 Tax=unclassified Breznakia TaxID=2623764 RepID=UPI0024075FDA|nr:MULTISPECIES: protein translocase subunit SecD [unclassified Breznakia]MDF9823896.1 SecD/SecF fusion protein [Breznakia sp. PM6-1]MDF9834695.1 SecD/SecF fusion protein [Breznakia sp. PF5-3]MDF9836870.1 SecD/SecF fusion protein [Breznakia sp. PFB2-8]MDF9858887.1 SecD/SecF fusion protein [Breznakia sp. PH5-24]